MDWAEQTSLFNQNVIVIFTVIDTYGLSNNTVSIRKIT